MLGGDITGPRLLVLKGLLFALLAAMAGAVLYWQTPGWRTLALLGVVAWASARFYYFLFYVIHNYVDSSRRYAGISDLLRSGFRARERKNE